MSEPASTPAPDAAYEALTAIGYNAAAARSISLRARSYDQDAERIVALALEDAANTRMITAAERSDNGDSDDR